MLTDGMTRMPTLSGMRRRITLIASIRVFCEKVGLAKRENAIEMELEFCLREDLNKCFKRSCSVERRTAEGHHFELPRR